MFVPMSEKTLCSREGLRLKQGGSPAVSGMGQIETLLAEPQGFTAGRPHLRLIQAELQGNQTLFNLAVISRITLIACR